MSSDLTIPTHYEAPPAALPESPAPKHLGNLDKHFSLIANWANYLADENYIIGSRIVYFLSAAISAVAIPVIAIWGLGCSAKNLSQGNFEKARAIFAEILPLAEKYLACSLASLAGVFAAKTISSWFQTTFKSQQPNAVDLLAEGFAYPFFVANKAAAMGAFFTTRTLYIAQIVASIFALVVIPLSGIAFSVLDLAKGNFKDSFTSITYIVPNIWFQVKVLAGSVFGAVIPLPLNRGLRGVEKQTEPAPDAPPIRPSQGDFLDNAISLALDFSNLMKWARDNQRGEPASLAPQDFSSQDALRLASDFRDLTQWTRQP